MFLSPKAQAVFLLCEGERALTRLKTWFLNIENVGITAWGGGEGAGGTGARRIGHFEK